MTRAADSVPPVAIETYARYLPELILERIVAGRAAEQKASVEQFRCAVMFADISGFTALTERLAAPGAGGNKKLTATLNAYFTRLIRRVSEHGGDVDEVGFPYRLG